jgi:hypothetical protein
MIFVGLIIFSIGVVSFISQLAYTYDEFHDKDLTTARRLVRLIGILDLYLLSLVAIFIGYEVTIAAIFH